MFYFTVSEIDNIYFDISSSLYKIHLRNITEIAFIGIPFQNLPNQKGIEGQNNGKMEDCAAENSMLDKAHFHFSNHN